MHRKGIIHIISFTLMAKKLTVRARVHHGSKSLDLTIPVAICHEGNIIEGDIFTVETEKSKDDLILKYTRVFQQNK